MSLFMFFLNLVIRPPFLSILRQHLSSSFGLSDRSDRSSSLTNTVDAIGWTGFLRQASAMTTSSTLNTTDSNEDAGTRPYSEISATGPFYNWCFLQLCGVAIDVGISLAEGFPLFALWILLIVLF